jgi:hypothetical protein
MKNIFTLIFIVLLSGTAVSSEHQSIISQHFANLKLMDINDFDTKTINSQLPPKELKSFNGIFGFTSNDFDGNGITDFVALTYDKNSEPESIRNYYIREYSLILCLKNIKFSCELIKKFRRGYPSQYYLSSGNISEDSQCKGKLFSKGTTAFFLEPALGNIIEWGVYNSGKVIMCSAGD